jgi:hypothetical protein
VSLLADVLLLALAVALLCAAGAAAGWLAATVLDYREARAANRGARLLP